jgi:uncharacterized protein (DUF2249 family)
MTAELPDFDPSQVADLDVRDVIREGGEPLPAILAAADRLAPGQVLHLRSPFQPVPLYAVMGERGFVHFSTMFTPQDWSTWFWHEGEQVERAGSSPPLARSSAPDGSWDLRDLPPPEPLLAILERVETATAPFRVVLPFEPAPLAALLDGQGWLMSVTETLPDGSVVVAILPGGC